jgi:transposase-like protein
MTELIKSGLRYKANRPDQFNTPSLAPASDLANQAAPSQPLTTTRQLALAKLPPVETIQRELAQARSIDDFFGKQGILARLFASTISELMEAELTEHLGYERYSREGQGQGNSRNGKRPRNLHTDLGDVTVAIPRDRNSTFQPRVLEAYQTGTNELEKKILYLYAKGMSTRDVEELLREIYGVELSATSISAITDKIKGQAELWQRRPLAEIYPIIYLDALVVKLRREGKVENIPVYVVLGLDLEGRKDILGHWLGNGAEGAKFWLSVVSELQARGVKDVFIACVDGLTGFSEAINAIYPRTLVQRCLVHQVRNSMRYVNYKDQKAFCADLKTIYQAPTRAAAEECLLNVTEKWGHKYGAAMHSWETHWEELAVMFEFPSEIRRLIYTTNPIEGYNRQLRRVTKTKAAFPTDDAVLKLLYLAQSDITEKWTMPVVNWASILNQLAIYFAGRIPA